MFWALEIDPARVYKQKVSKSYHVSMACLQPSKCTDSNYTTLILKKDGSEFVLCNLHKDKVVQVQLDLMFGAGEEIAFSLLGGKNKVYLSGYVVDEDEDKFFEGSDSELEDFQTVQQGKRKIEASSIETKNKKAKTNSEKSDEDSVGSEVVEDCYSDPNEEDDGEDEEDEDEAEDEEESDSGSESDDELDSEEESTPMKVAAAKSPDKAKKKMPNAKQQQFNEKMQQKTPDSQVNGKTPTSKKKNKGNKTPGGDDATPKGQKTPDSSKQITPQKMKLEGGVVAIDTKPGSGAPAKAGRKVAVYYTGRLQQNNKQFDSTTQGKGFVFQLGRGEVIKGWDIGVTGMKVGGKRKIIVPAPLAYGSKGSPPVIPPNANLVFEVELKNIF